MKKIALCLFIGLTVFAAGCDSKVKLGGKVSYSDDGSPLNVGTVCFEAEMYLARGMLQPDGTYTLGSLKEKDGIPPGRYQVYVSGAVKEVGVGRDGMAITESLIDDKFASPSKSGLVVEINDSTKRYDFQVDRR